MQCVAPYSDLVNTPQPYYNLDSMKHELFSRANTTFGLARRLAEVSKDTQERYANRTRKLRDIEVTDRVYVQKKSHVSKFDAKYAGPMRVIKKPGVVF